MSLRRSLAVIAVFSALVIGLLGTPARARPKRDPCGPRVPGWHTLDLSDPCGCLGPAYNRAPIRVDP